METLVKDLRYAIRSLLNRPAFAAIAVLTLALGIGANTAIFSVINAVLLRPLDYAEPEHLVTFRSNQSAPDLTDVTMASHAFSKLGGEVLAPLAYTGAAEPIQFQIGQVTGGYFETLSVEMRLIDQQLATQYPADNKNRSSMLIRLQERIVGQSRNALLILFAAVSLVLLIACANFANLLLARAAERGREIVIRTALGAGRWRIIRQLLTESILISILGGAAGVLIAWWGINLLIALKPENLPRLQEINVDLRVFAFTFGLSVLTGLIFGMLPAWTASRGAVNSGLKEGGRSATSGRGQQRMCSPFVVAGLAVAPGLVVCAG